MWPMENEEKVEKAEGRAGFVRWVSWAFRGATLTTISRFGVASSGPTMRINYAHKPSRLM